MEIVNAIQGVVSITALYKLFTIAIVFDMITGLTKALKNHEFMPSIMRNGLFVSFGEVLLLTLCLIVERYAPISSNIIYVLMCFMVIKELSSICENLVQIGVNIPEWLTSGFQVYIDNLNRK